ncbi:ABC transporter permease [Metabacillus sp. RGM 3146]|uniref:ABC transporter permease n=1 Tax=Metabacillus sp. RGM 3146 TaxID=3401092 RepID=UPI003B9CFE1F
MIVWKSVLKSLKQNIFQLSGSIILMALAVMLFLMLQTAIGSVAKSNQDFIKKNHQEDFQFYTSAPLKSETLKKLSQQYQVTLSERTFVDADWGKGGTLRLLSINYSINIPYLETGKLPEKKDELALFKGFAAANHYKTGDQIRLSGKVFQITGIAYLPDYIYPVKNEADLSSDPKTFGAAAASDSAIQSLQSKPGFYYMGEIRKSPFNKEELKKAVLKEAPILKWMDRKDNPRISFVEAKIKSSESIVTTFPLLIAAIVMLMTMLIINRKLKHQQKQIGTLLAMGYFPSEISKAYMIYPLFVSLSGSILGAGFGLLLSVPMTAYYTSYFNVPLLSPMSLDLTGILIAFLLQLLLLSIAGYLAIRQTVTQPVLTLLSAGGGNKRTKKKNLHKRQLYNPLQTENAFEQPFESSCSFLWDCFVFCSGHVWFFDNELCRFNDKENLCRNLSVSLCCLLQGSRGEASFFK